jgi:hypothetical protein
MDVSSSSALHLFDSVFDSTAKSARNNELPVKQSAIKPVADMSQFNAFDSSEFWSSAGIGKNAVGTHKLSKSNVADFTGFDFWSQGPTKSVQEFRTGSVSVEQQQVKSSRVSPTN